MEHIINPVDFSDHSEFALQTGAVLAKKHNAKLHILHMLAIFKSLITNSDTVNQNEMMFLLALAKKN